MHWSDMVILGLIVGGTYIGYKRGLVLEVTDWAMGILGLTLAFRIYRPLAKGLHGGVLHGWSLGSVEWLAFLFFLIPTVITVLSIGLHIDRITKEQDRIPPEVRMYGGLIVSFVKYIVISCLFIGWMPSTGGLSGPDAEDFRKGMMVNMMRGLNPPAVALVRLACPSDLADKFIAEMNKH